MIGRVASRSAPSASWAIGEVTAYWCSVGSIGSVRPTVSAIAGPHTPAQHTTTSASIVSPVVVRTPRTAPRSVMISETAVSPTKLAPFAAGRAAPAPPPPPPPPRAAPPPPPPAARRGPGAPFPVGGVRAEQAVALDRRPRRDRFVGPDHPAPP